ncbi:hypothetical protein Pryu01_02602 [Paraliobacillus ryukyuensis]|uniref:ABC-2 family transporter n=1 Tax=Paraliobacillus ryukyuensis TaxID=200904 RepID=A0A366EBQ1_9BACI|nr:ABC-2 transporter permease [Paraliobacillus ryukyuensis]RBO99757.1 ABC-2 family transporter [Paraliobacillus ryukyuensis]
MQAMIALWKKDWFVNWKTIFMCALLICLYSPMIANVFIFGLLIMLNCFSVFREDKQSLVYIFLKSLPTRPKTIVYSRYTLLLMLVCLSTLLMWLLNWWVSYAKRDDPLNFIYPYQVQDVIFIFSIILIILSISLPMVYFFKSQLVVYSLMICWGGLWLLAFYWSDAYAEKQNQYDFFEQSTRGASDWLALVMPLSSGVTVILGVIAYLASMFLTEQLLKRKP